MTISISLIFGYDFSEHSVQIQMKALDAAVRLWMVRRSVQLVHFEQLVDFAEEVGMELRSVVHQNPSGRTPAREYLVDKHFCDCRSSVVPHRKRFGRLREDIDDRNHIFVATSGFGLRSSYVDFSIDIIISQG